MRYNGHYNWQQASQTQQANPPINQQASQTQNEITLLHYNEKNQTYKRLEIIQDTKGVIIKLTEGKKGETPTSITFSLNPQELAYLALSLTKLFNKI